MMEKIGVICPLPDELIRGAIIGTVSVIDVVTESNSPWFFGPRGLVLSDPKPISAIPCSGALGYFAWQRGGAIDEPKPWMCAWPLGRRQNKQPVKSDNKDLFGEAG